jgi:hypothetical protein
MDFEFFFQVCHDVGEYWLVVAEKKAMVSPDAHSEEFVLSAVDVDTKIV